MLNPYSYRVILFYKIYCRIAKKFENGTFDRPVRTQEFILSRKITWETVDDGQRSKKQSNLSAGPCCKVVALREFAVTSLTKGQHEFMCRGAGAAAKNGWTFVCLHSPMSKKHAAVPDSASQKSLMRQKQNLKSHSSRNEAALRHTYASAS